MVETLVFISKIITYHYLTKVGSLVPKPLWEELCSIDLLILIIIRIAQVTLRSITKAIP